MSSRTPINNYRNFSSLRKKLHLFVFQMQKILLNSVNNNVQRATAQSSTVAERSVFFRALVAGDGFRLGLKLQVSHHSLLCC